MEEDEYAEPEGDWDAPRTEPGMHDCYTCGAPEYYCPGTYPGGECNDKV